MSTISPLNASTVTATRIPTASSPAAQAFETVVPKAHGTEKETTDTPYTENTASSETLSALLAAQEAASAPPETRVINGHEVLVSGHSLDNNIQGGSLFRTTNAFSIESLNQFAEQQMAPEEREGQNSMSASHDRPQMTVISSEALSAPPAGATGRYMNVSYDAPKGQHAGLLTLKEGENSDAYYAKAVGSLMDMVGVERELKQEYGEDIKLIYSHADASYIMLTPDDARYAEMAGAEENVQNVLSEIHKGFINPDAVREPLAEYGYYV